MTIYRVIAVMLVAVVLSACGGGGSKVTNGNTSTPPGTTIINGVAANGLIRNGKVKAYLLTNDGGKILLTETVTNSEGRYTLSIQNQTGPVLIEVSGGTYIDEATGYTIPVTSPVRAVVASASAASLEIAVTPLTELAVLLAGATPTATSITAANSKVSDLFNIDITTTQPVEPTLQAFQSATTAQKDYSLALAGISQQMKDTSITSIAAALEPYRSEIARDGRLSTTVTDTFKSEVSTFLGTSRNQTGTTSIASTGLAAMGNIGYSVKLSTTGIFAASSFIKGIELRLQLPAGVTVKADGNSIPLTGTVTPSGAAATHSTVQSLYNPTTGVLSLGIINAEPGFALGEFITIACDVSPGASLNTSAFSISDLTVSDVNGENIGGISVLVNL